MHGANLALQCRSGWNILLKSVITVGPSTRLERTVSCVTMAVNYSRRCIAASGQCTEGILRFSGTMQCIGRIVPSQLMKAVLRERHGGVHTRVKGRRFWVQRSLSASFRFFSPGQISLAQIRAFPSCCDSVRDRQRADVLRQSLTLGVVVLPRCYLQHRTLNCSFTFFSHYLLILR